MTASTKMFSLEGRGLKMTTAEDLEPHIKELRGMEDLEEVRILGNTLGIGACKLLGEVLSTKKNLQVRFLGPRYPMRATNHLVACHRSPTLRISSLAASSTRSPRPSASSSTPSSTYRSSAPST
ncbi:hypothetical protein IMZ48_27740 [Candidatus Bathyarchaeota archaeon]|nr:hypothetical protein [Candidatus Bathyarchaeota archaeon]